MATVTAQPGIKTAFAGGSDDLICTFSPAARKGVQIESQGFTLDGATIQVKGISSDYDTIAFTEAKHIAVVGVQSGGLTGQIRISGVTAGSWFVTVVEI